MNRVNAVATEVTLDLPGEFARAAGSAVGQRRIRAVLRHWPLLVVLAAGLALRLPYIGEGGGYDARIYSTFASSVLEWGQNFDGYHLSRYSAFPFAHPPLFPILYAPLNWLALRTGGWYVAAANGLIYAFEVAAAVLLYALARRATHPARYAARRPSWAAPWVPWSPGLVAALFYLVPVTPFWLRWRGGQAPDTQYMWIAVAWLLAAVYCAASPRLAGTLFGLALITRTEMAALALPFALHFARQSLTRAGWFVACAGSAVALVFGPFVLRDWRAVDWALRGHLASRLWEPDALVWRWPWGEPPAALLQAVLPIQPALLAGTILLATVISWRDPRLERRLTLVALAQVLTMPVFHNRYGAHAFALALALVARTGAVWLAAGWVLAALRFDFNVATVGLPALGLAWQSVTASLRAASVPASSDVAADAVAFHDPLRDWMTRRLRDARRLPVWTPAGAIALAVVSVLVARAQTEPALDARVGQLELMGLLAGVPAEGVAPPFALAAWVAGSFGPNAIWSLNVLTAAAAGVALLLLSTLAARIPPGRPARLTTGTLVALAGGVWVLGRSSAFEADPAPLGAAFALALLWVIARRLAPARSDASPARSRALAGWAALFALAVTPFLFAVRGVFIPVPVGEPGIERQLTVDEAVALLMRSLTPSSAWLWQPSTPRSPTAYTDVVIRNIDRLDRNAIVCAGAKDLWGWRFARFIDRVRPDVSVFAADAATCVDWVIPVFASTRPVYATSLSTSDLLHSGYVFFPAHGVWRAVEPWPTFGEGSVLKGPDDRIYLLESGRRRWIPSLTAFEQAGLSWGDVKLVPAELLATYLEGPPLPP